MSKSQPSTIVAQSASASKTAYNEAKLTAATLAELKGKHPNFTGDWVHLVHLETALRKPSSDSKRFLAWNHWRDKSIDGDQPEDKVVHLEGISLRSVDFRGINLEGAQLRDAKIAASDFRGARLAGAVLQEANLSFSDFANADLTGVQLKDANLDHANLREANLSQADLDAAILSNAKLKEAQCVEAKFTRAKLVSANFSNVDATSADFHRANLADAIFESATLDQAQFTEADLSYANLQNASLKKVNFQRANLLGIAAHGADCEGADFTEAVLRQANLGNCNLLSIKGMLLDETFVTGGEFDAKAEDPWSRLLQTYTWKNFALVCLMFSLLLIPYLLGGYFKPPQQLIERPIPERLEEISTNFFKIDHTDFEIREFLNFRYDEYYAPMVSDLDSRATHYYLALGGVDGIIFYLTILVIIFCLLQRIALTRDIHQLQAKNAIFRRTPKLSEYMGPYSSIGEEPKSWLYAITKWVEGHFLETQTGHGQTVKSSRPFRWLSLPGWGLSAMESIKPLWKAMPAFIKSTPPPSWIDALGMTRVDRMNQSLTWAILVITLFMICRVIIESILHTQLTLGG
ncbi:hypothetical protein GC197_08065 [bacterium]|nr:hypothetical protein [bacterium]